VTTALVTGSPAAAEQVAAALRAAGAEAVCVTDPDRLAEAISAFPPHSLDCYVQLPIALRPTGETVVARVRAFLDGGLITRFRLAEAVLPALSEGGRVVLVAGHTPVDPNVPDDQAARRAFLEVLAHAIRADQAPAKPRVRVVDHEQGAEDIARIALTGERPRTEAKPLRDLSDREAGMTYQDWRTEVMGLVTLEF